MAGWFSDIEANWISSIPCVTNSSADQIEEKYLPDELKKPMSILTVPDEKTVEGDSSDSDEEIPLIDEGGYDYKFIRKFKKIEDEDLVCPICQLVSRDPQQSECCGKIFCKICVTTREDLYPFCESCPNCLHETFKLFSDKRSSRSIANLKVYCTRKQKGCDWEGTVEQVESHSNECSYTVVACSNHCGKRLYRHKLNMHLVKFCPKRPFQCGLCKERGQWVYITGEHEKKCPEKLIMCKNKNCGEMIKRCNMDDHQSVCPKKVLCCVYADLGCKATCTREEMQQHNVHYIHQHLDLAANVARNLDVHKLDHLLQVAPVVLRIHNFSQSSQLRSQPFLTSVKGYKMCILVDHTINFSFCLMPGKYDDSLSWPFRGKITVSLLNQVEDSNHQKVIAIFRPPRRLGEIKIRRVRNEDGPANRIGSYHIRGQSKRETLMSLEQLGHLVNDTVCLSVSYIQ